MKNILLLSIALMALTLISCGDDAGPEVTITSPSDDAAIMLADSSFTVDFTITDDVDIASIVLNSPGFATGSVPAADLAGAADTEFNGRFEVPTGTEAGEYTLTLTATDNEGNTGSDEVTVNIN